MTASRNRPLSSHFSLFFSRNYQSKAAFAIMAVICLLVSRADAKYGGGTGEPNNPYRIATPNDLNDIGNHVEDFNKSFVMVNDINLADYTGTQFNIIGDHDHPFTGVFDGNGWTVSNFSYGVSGASWIGLFGYVRGNNAVIRNLVMVEPHVNEPQDMCIGCLVGELDEGMISNCQILNGTVHSEMTAGLLVGYSGEVGEIVRCSVTGYITGNEIVGGLGGVNQGQLVGCSATADVNGRNGAIGGLVGGNGNNGTISNCYATGSVEGKDGVGGLTGENGGTLLNCYAAGVVDGNEDTGGLVGSNLSGSYTKCFWDRDVNPDVNGIGDANDPNVIGKTNAEMQTESTFTDAGWDFVEIWNIGENQTYPFLRTHSAGDLDHNDKVNFSDVGILCSHWLEEK